MESKFKCIRDYKINGQIHFHKGRFYRAKVTYDNRWYKFPYMDCSFNFQTHSVHAPYYIYDTFIKKNNFTYGK